MPFVTSQTSSHLVLLPEDYVPRGKVIKRWYFPRNISHLSSRNSSKKMTILSRRSIAWYTLLESKGKCVVLQLCVSKFFTSRGKVRERWCFPWNVAHLSRRNYWGKSESEVCRLLGHRIHMDYVKLTWTKPGMKEYNTFISNRVCQSDAIWSSIRIL